MNTHRLLCIVARSGLIFSLLALAIGSVREEFAVAATTTRAFVLPYDVSILVNNDGSLDVTESITVYSVEGTIAGGDRWIPTDATNGISLVRMTGLSVGTNFRQVSFEEIASRNTTASDGSMKTKTDGTGLFSVRTVSGDAPQIHIDFIFPYSIVPDQHYAYNLSYHVEGGLRGYPSQNPPVQQLWWNAVGDEFSKMVYVAKGSVKVTLPRSVPVEKVLASHNGVTESAAKLSADGQVFHWSFEKLPRNEGFEVRLQFPWIATDAAVPAWQIEMDAANEQEQWLHLVLLIVGLGVAGFGGAAIGVWWYARGRDPYTGLIAETITSPPSDLPPALAGALLDESVDARDIVAILLGLQKRGTVEITRRTKEQTGTTERWVPDQSFKLALLPGEISAPDRIVLESIFGKEMKEGAEKPVSEVGALLLNRFPEIKDAIYDDLVARKLMVQSPALTRRRWRVAGAILVLIGFAVGVAGVVLKERVSLVPVVAFVALGAGMFGFSRAMPRKTLKGTEEAAKFRAFQRYLRSLSPFGADQTLERYLPYTIALGVNLQWVNQLMSTHQMPGEGGWKDRLGELFEGSAWLDGNWSDMRPPASDWSPPPYGGPHTGGIPGSYGSSWPDTFPSVPGHGGIGEASRGAQGAIGEASKETSGLLLGLEILLGIGSIFLGGGKGGGGGGGSFHS